MTDPKTPAGRPAAAPAAPAARTGAPPPAPAEPAAAKSATGTAAAPARDRWPMRLGLFLLAGLVAAGAAIPLAGLTQTAATANTSVRVAPAPGPGVNLSDEEIRALQDIEGGDLEAQSTVVSLAGLAVFGALLAGLLGLAAGVCSGSGGQAGLGFVAGLALGALCGAAGGYLGQLLAVNASLREATGEEIVTLMIGMAVALGLVGIAAGAAVRVGCGPRVKWDSPITAGAAGGIVTGVLLPFLAPIVSSIFPSLIDPRGLAAVIPVDTADRAFCLIPAAILIAVATARAAAPTKPAVAVRKTTEPDPVAA